MIVFFSFFSFSFRETQQEQLPLDYSKKKMETVIKEKLFLFVLEGLEEIFFYAKGGLKNINLITAIQF